MREKELIVYRDFEDGELLYDMAFPHVPLR